MVTQNDIPNSHNLTDTVSWRTFKEFDNHEFIIALTDESSGLKAFVGVHNTNRGPALGGTRFKTYVDESAAMRDVMNLSRAMSYKCALANLPYGGGKAVIMADDSLDRQQVLTAYARLIEKLRGLFKTGTDVGISDADVVHMAASTSHMLGVVAADRGELSTSKVASLGVFYGMKAALQHLYNKPDFQGRSVAIKGAGKLGGEIARLVTEAGGKVYISDIVEAACHDLKKQLPSITIVDNDDIHKQPVDIYSPCALGNEFNSKTIPQLNCQAVVGGANNQLYDSSAGDQLHARNILYAPDYVANAGGLIYVADELEPGGFDKRRVLERTSQIESTLSLIFEDAKSQNLPTYKVADTLGFERMNGVARE